MKISVVLFVVSLLFVGLAAQAYDDSPKAAKCVAACNRQYSGPFRACREVAQCRAFVQQEADNCIHRCPNVSEESSGAGR
jgi:hypothetical protein